MRGIKLWWPVAWILLALVVAVPEAAAQTPQLTSEQRRMLEQLPASQRQQLERQFRQEQQRRQRDEHDRDDEREEFPDIESLPVDPTDPDEREARRPRLEGGDTVIIRLERDTDRWEALTTREQEQAEVVQRRIERANPYELDSLGQLELPGFTRIRLAGLTGSQAVIRLQAEPRLDGFSVRFTRLPLKPIAEDALKPFGYSMFDRRDDGDERRPTTFAPVTDIPVPADYVVGVGDTVAIQLFGNKNAEYQLIVSRDGRINFPELGPISVAGQKFDDLRAEIRERVTEQFIGTRVSVSLGELRSMRVFVLGDVRRPGAYTVSSLATVTHSLFVSGGVERTGSLRNVQVRRDGELRRTLDLYDLLLRGDSRDDIRLQAGDVIFVPPVGEQVTVYGEVRRPAIYELRGERTAGEMVNLAGGLLPRARPSAARVDRINPEEGVAVLSADLDSAEGRAFRLRDGDVLRVPEGVAQYDRSVRLDGNVFRPGAYQWREGFRLSDLIEGNRALRPRSDLNYVLIRREHVPNADIEVFSADLQAAWQAPGTDADPVLNPRDRVFVFNRDTGREHVIEPLLDELRLLSRPDSPHPIVRIGGRVQAPGDYPLEPGMTVSDLIRAGGGLDEAAYSRSAELARYESVGGQYRETRLENIDLQRVRAGIAEADVRLQPHDYLNIQELPRWREQESVEIVGEVAFPGSYPISPGDTLSSVIERAGGLSEFAFPQGAIFTRESLRDREREQLAQLARRLESDLASLALADPDNIEAVSVGQSLLQQIRTTEPTGRLVVNLETAIAGEPGRDIKLRDGDRLMIPDETQEVTVLGEVQFATSHLHDGALSRDDYIARSGGLTARADRRRIYVVRANGEVIADSGSRWFGQGQAARMEAGDTIVVPLDAERVRPLILWTNVTQVVYNLAIAAAAVNSF